MKQDLLLSLLLALLVVAAASTETWTNQWVASINGSRTDASNIVIQHGFTVLGEISPGLYHLKYHAAEVDRESPSHHHTHNLQLHPKINWASQHPKLIRHRKSNIPFTCNDPLWTNGQWYMNGVSASNIDVLSAWSKYTGQGVVVTVVDDGIEHDHPDLAANYDALASFDMNGNDADPYPNEADPINSHGTRCCGQIAMIFNNGICGVGVAYNARIGAVRMLDGDVTDSIEGRSLSLNPDHIDVYTNSWGPNDDGATMEGPGPLAQAAFLNGINNGRKGKGSIYLFAAGNGGWSDNCNADGYANNLYTIAIGAIGMDGTSPWYTEPCAATMAVTYSSGNGGQAGIATVDLHHGCTRFHGGTSAASPMAAGIVALALEANPNLGWRDVQHLMVRTSQKTNSQDPDWTINGAKWHINHKYGFGSLDAGLMTTMAATWKPVLTQLTFSSPTMLIDLPIPFATSRDKALSQTISVSSGDTAIRQLEHVQIQINLDCARRGDIVIELTSPMGTVSTMLTARPYDNDSTGIHWTMMTVRCWDESPVGLWTLTVRNAANSKPGTLEDWTLVLYGTGQPR